MHQIHTPNKLKRLNKQLAKFLVLFSCLFYLSFETNAQEYDEFPVQLIVKNLGITDIPVAIKDQEAYISITDLFEYLTLKYETGATPADISGFIINPSNSFTFNIAESFIKIKDENYTLTKDDYILTPTTLYLKSSLFGELFGLNSTFNFRNLSINLSTDLELPKIKELRLQRMRNNLDNIQGIVQPDTLIERKYPFFRAGMADWSVVSSQQSNGLNESRVNLGLGTMIAGGETNILLNYSTRVPFTSRNQFYQWKYVNNNSRIIKQVTAGKIFTRSTSSLFAPVVGMQLTNTPVINRRSFGTYTLTDVTDPRWTVELYVNNVLIDFTEADASGFFTFEVPLMYGNTAVNLRYYGPYGEERIEERNINIPYNFIPKNQLEYTLSAGIVENDDNNRFSRFNLNYGLSNGITIGGGVEYLSEVSSGEFMPFFNSSIRLAQGFLFSGEYMYGVKTEGLLSYRNPSNIQIDLNYINYNKDQTAINYNYLEERKISVSLPLRTKLFSAYSRFSVNQIVLPTTKFTSAQFLLSGSLFGISTNLTTFGLFNERSNNPTIYSTLSQTYRLPYQFIFSPQVQYDFSYSEVSNVILRLERPFLKNGFVNVGFENNFKRNAHIFEVGLRYNLNFAQTSFTSRIGNLNNTFVETARGSLLFDDNTNYVVAKDRSSVGKGAITIIPFLDLNNNEKFDKMEPEVSDMEIKNMGGYIVYNEAKTQLRIYDVQPYNQLIIQVDTLSLDNIAWKVEKSIIAIETVPNQFKTIYVPIKVLGEVAGMVYLENYNKVEGQGRILVSILNDQDKVVAEVMTEGDGYFTYLGLKPGRYTAQINTEQLKNLNFKAAPASKSFEIEVSEYGAIVDDLEFTLMPLNQE